MALNKITPRSVQLLAFSSARIFFSTLGSYYGGPLNNASSVTSSEAGFMGSGVTEAAFFLPLMILPFIFKNDSDALEAVDVPIHVLLSLSVFFTSVFGVLIQEGQNHTHLSAHDQASSTAYGSFLSILPACLMTFLAFLICCPNDMDDTLSEETRRNSNSLLSKAPISTIMGLSLSRFALAALVNVTGTLNSSFNTRTSIEAGVIGLAIPEAVSFLSLASLRCINRNYLPIALLLTQGAIILFLPLLTQLGSHIQKINNRDHIAAYEQLQVTMLGEFITDGMMSALSLIAICLIGCIRSCGYDCESSSSSEHDPINSRYALYGGTESSEYQRLHNDGDPEHSLGMGR